MKFQKRLVVGLAIGLFILGAWVFLQPSSAWAAGETCVNGSSAPCEEDIQLLGCTLCHSIRLMGGNRNGTDRQIWAATGTNRHETAPKRADWTATVQSMIDKGSPAILELTAGYLNTNYCTSCTGPILGSPVPTTATITDTTATVTWTTSNSAFGDENTNTVLYYGTNKADVLLGPGCSSCQVVSISESVGNHTVNLTGLSSFTQYYLVNEATSGLGTTRSKYAPSFRTKRPSGGGGECIPATDPIPSRVYFSSQTATPSIGVLDPATDTVVASIPVNDTPSEMVAHPDGSTLYTMVGTSLSVVDVQGNVELGSVLGVGQFIFQHLAMDPDGSKLYLLYRQLSPRTLKIKVFDTTDPTTPTLMATISDPLFDICYAPLGLAVKPDGSQLYVACQNADTTKSDHFYMVDTATHAVTYTASYPRDDGQYFFVNALTVKPDGSTVYLALNNRQTGSRIQLFDGATGVKSGAIMLGLDSSPRAGAVTPDGSRLYVVDQQQGTHVIDTATNTVTKTMTKTKSYGVDLAMAADGTAAYTSMLFEIHHLNVSTDSWSATVTSGVDGAWQLATTPGRPGTPEVCPPGGGGPIPSYIYVSDAGDPYQIAVIDPLTDLQVASIPSNGTPSESVAHPDGSVVYVMEDTDLAVIDVLGNVELSSVLGAGEFIFQHLAMAPDGSKLYLLYRQIAPRTLKIKVFDTTDPTMPSLITTISDPLFDICYAPLGLAVKPDGSQLYVACQNANTANADHFYMVNAGTYAVTYTDSFPRDDGQYFFVNALAVSPDGGKVYLARSNRDTGSTVQSFDGATGLKSGAVALGLNSSPRAAVFTPDGSKLYVVDQQKGTHLINPATNTLTLTMPKTKSYGLDIAITPDGDHFYTTLLFEIHDIYTPTNSWFKTIKGNENDFSGAWQITISPGNPGTP
jgi:YVTN family beta-propeller protein